MAKVQTKQNEVENQQPTDNQQASRILPDLTAHGILPDVDISEYVGRRARGARMYETQARALVEAGRGCFVIPVPDESKLSGYRARVTTLNKLNLGRKLISAVATKAHPDGHWQAGDLLVRLAD